MNRRAAFFALFALLPPLLAGCGAPQYSEKIVETVAEEERAPAKTGGGKYYLDDGPPEIVPEDIAAIPDAAPKREKIIAATTRPYSALGKRWTPNSEVRPHREQGTASWYGRRYHGRPTASGETYDMFKMTAAHPFLAIPSYARVTRVDTGASVVVRINDRGPFLGGRVIDLSFAAASRLGFAEHGTGEVVVEAIVPEGAQESAAKESAPLQESAAAADAPSNISGAPLQKFAALRLYIQLGAFKIEANAKNMRRRLREEGMGDLPNKIHTRDDLYLFLVGPYSDRKAALADDRALCAAAADLCGFLTLAP